MDPMELRRRRADKIEEARAILNKAKEESRSLNADETGKHDQLLAEIDQLKKDVERAERQEGLDNELRSGGQQRVIEPPVVTPQQQELQHYRSLGDQLIDVARFYRGMPLSPALSEYRAITGASETVPADGGFLVQTDFVSELMKRTYATGILAPRCRELTISGPANSVTMNAVDESDRATGSRWGGIRGYWQAEGDSTTKSKPKFMTMTLKLKKMMGLCYATEELLADAAALESVIMQGFSEEFGFMLDDAIINGTGAGQPLGILNASCLVSQAKETGQAAATVVAENVIKMDSRLWPRSAGSAVWLINNEIKPQLYTMSIPVGTGGIPVFMPANGLSGSPYGTLLGRPIIPIEQCAALGTKGDILLVDLSQYLLARKGGIQAAQSIHVQFLTDETTFRFIQRVDGQPGWSSALTPYKGSATQSPFVSLDTRA